MLVHQLVESSRYVTTRVQHSIDIFLLNPLKKVTITVSSIVIRVLCLIYKEKIIFFKVKLTAIGFSNNMWYPFFANATVGSYIDYKM